MKDTGGGGEEASAPSTAWLCGGACFESNILLCSRLDPRSTPPLQKQHSTMTWGWGEAVFWSVARDVTERVAPAKRHAYQCFLPAA